MPHDDLTPRAQVGAERQPGHIGFAADSMIEVEGENWRVHEPKYQPSAVCVDPDGYKWFAIVRKRPGYARGLAVLSPEGRNWWFYRAGRGNDGIRTLDWIDGIVCDSPESIWFMGDDGVARLRPDR